MKSISTLLAVGVGLLLTASSGVVADAGSDNDLATLNYALTLERLEAAFYAKGQAQYKAADFAAAKFDGAYDYFTLIASHEASHVTALVNTITSLGGTPVPICTYSFDASGFTSVSDYVSQALTLESAGVSAYDGALNAFSSEALMTVAATIATIEARHTSFLATLQSKSPFPANNAATDTASSPSDIVKAAAGFFVKCPYDLTAAAAAVIVRPTGVKTASTLAAATTSSTKPTVTAAAYTQNQFNNDMTALNYALTLEHLEAEFYNAVGPRYNQAAFETAYPGKGASYFTNFGLIKVHENAHVDALTKTITDRGGMAVPVCQYNFTLAKIPDIQTYVATAKLLENTGVSAYDGAANTFTDTGLQLIAATIVTVEARHAAFLNGIVDPAKGAVTTDSFDSPVAPGDIVAAVLKSGLIISCPYTPAGPVAPSSYNKPSAASSLDASAPAVLVAAIVALLSILQMF